MRSRLFTSEEKVEKVSDEQDALIDQKALDSKIDWILSFSLKYDEGQYGGAHLGEKVFAKPAWAQI